jgi:hypothetical protein
MAQRGAWKGELQALVTPAAHEWQMNLGGVHYGMVAIKKKKG